MVQGILGENMPVRLELELELEDDPARCSPPVHYKPKLPKLSQF